MGVLRRTIFSCVPAARGPTDGWSQVGRLLGRRVFGDGLGTFGDGVLGKFSGQQQTNGGLDLSARDG